MKNLSSWLIVMFMIMFLGFRVIVAISGSMDGDFFIKPIDNTVEIVLLFVVLLCVPLIFKRKLIGAIIYLGAYGWYFGRGLITNVMQLVNEETLGVDTYMSMFVALIGIAIPLVALFDVLIDKNRMKNPVDKQTDWFYKNKDYDRQLDERADKNNYRTM